MTIDEQVEQMKQHIADETNPARMSADEARQYYEGLVVWLEGSLEGLEDDAAE